MTMPPMQIDTQQVVEKLTGAGVPHRQARAHASVLSDALQDVDLRFHDRFVTKPELNEALAPIHDALIRIEGKMEALEAKLEAKIDSLDAKMDAKIDAAIAKLKAEVALWIVTAGIFQTGLITALLIEIVN